VSAIASTSVFVRDHQLFAREQRDHAAPVGRHHDLLLDPRRRPPVFCGTVRLEREQHALLDLQRVHERVQPRDDRPLVQAHPDAVAELQPERVHLVLEPELLGLRPHRRDLVGGGAGLHQVDRRVHPFARSLERVPLRGRRAPDDERPVVAGPVAVEDVDDVEVRLVPGPDQTVREDVRVRAAAFAGDRVDRLDELRAHLEQACVRERDDVALADTGLEGLEDVLVDPVHHRAGLRQQRDLVGALDLPCVGHHLLTVADLDARLRERQEDRRLGHVHPQGKVADAVLLHDRADLPRGTRLQADARVDRALQARVPADRVRLVVQVRQLQPVGLRGRAEVEDPRATRAREQRVPLALVERPVPDLRGGQVADVAGLEQQQRPQLRGLERLAGAFEPIGAQAFEVDPDLPVDAGDAWRRGGRHREAVRAHQRSPLSPVPCPPIRCSEP
jgi:hypothetical protein